MDLQILHEELTTRLAKVQTKLHKLENAGEYGTSRYDDLSNQEMNLSEEIDALEEEMDR